MARTRHLSLAALAAGVLALGACEGGDAVPTGPADDGVPVNEHADPPPPEHPDPTDELEEPDPGQPPADADEDG